MSNLDIITSIIDQTDKLITTAYKKITKGTSFWERSPLEDICEAIDKLYIYTVYQCDIGEYSINIGENIIDRIIYLKTVMLYIYNKTLPYNINILIKIKKSELLADTIKEGHEQYIYSIIPPLIPINPPAYNTLVSSHLNSNSV